MNSFNGFYSFGKEKFFRKSYITGYPFTYIYTYIIKHYNPSVRIIDPVSHTNYVVCVNFIHKWRDLQFKVDSEQQIFLRNFSWQFYLLSELLPEICWEEIAKEIRISFWCLAWDANPGLSSNKPTHYLLDHSLAWVIYLVFSKLSIKQGQ